MKEVLEELVIIGGGAAGLMAASICSENHVKCTIIEHTDCLGKKILSTGNGKCNMTNYVMDENKYYCEDNFFVRDILERVSPEDLIETFNGFGLITRERNGYVYPYSEQASAVRNVLMEQCDNDLVHIEFNGSVKSIEKIEDGYKIVLSDRAIYSKRVLICTGGKSFAKSGSDGSGYKLAKNLSHNITIATPALSALICAEKHYKELKGVRVKGKISLYQVEGKGRALREADERVCIATEYGEIQFTDYGISGIPVFNISRVAADLLKKRKRIVAEIDFMSEYNSYEVMKLLKDMAEMYPDRTVVEQLSYLLNQKLALTILKLLSIDRSRKLFQLTEAEIKQVIDQIKCYRTEIANIKGFEFAQVTAGGVSVEEIDSTTMESKIHPGLYFAGEVIDVDGICGGYNLHFAWASAMIAANSILASIKE